MITIQEAINNFKELIDNSIIEKGQEGKESMIRSSEPIMNIHDAVKSSLISSGVSAELIYPPLFERRPELKLAGSLKKKDQDICVVPNDREMVSEILSRGLLENTIDEFGEDYTRETLVVNVRSQISSIQKNFDTLYERTISEAQNLHDRCNEMVLGEVYLLAVPEYNDAAFKNYECEFKRVNTKLVEKYIKSFQAITGRTDASDYLYQYEATCLLIVDFSRPIPKIYNTTQELIDDGLLLPTSTVVYEGLDWNSFTPKLLDIYNTRFGAGKLI